jgi:hypothetical protein
MLSAGPLEAEFGRHIAVAVPLAGFEGLKQRLHTAPR